MEQIIIRDQQSIIIIMIIYVWLLAVGSWCEPVVTTPWFLIKHYISLVDKVQLVRFPPRQAHFWLAWVYIAGKAEL